MIVLILNGPAGVGKGTFLDILKGWANFAIYKRSSIAWAKEVITDKFGWKGDKTPENRKLLGEVKRLGIKYGDLPFKDVKKHLNIAARCSARWFATDIREPDEIRKLVQYCEERDIECYTIRIYNKKKEKEALDHLAETDNIYSDYQYDYGYVNNGSIADFKMQIMESSLCLLLKKEG